MIGIAGVGFLAPGAFAQRDAAEQPTVPGVTRESRPIATPPYNPQSETKTTRSETNANFVRVSELIGSNVESQGGKKIGKIAEVMADGTGQTIQFAVLGKGGFFGIGEQLLPVPWQSLEAQKGQEDFALKIDDEKLGSAPKLQGGRYEELDRAEFTSRVYEFYGVQPEAVGSPNSKGELQKGEAQEPQGTE